MACRIRQESFIQETRHPSCESNKTQIEDPGERACLAERYSSPEGSDVHSVPSAPPFPNLPPQAKLACSLPPALPCLPLFLLCSSVYRKYPKYLSGESRRLPTGHLCQRDGDQPQLWAPHPGWCCQPHPGQMQHLAAGRAQRKPHRVAAAEGAKQRQRFSIWTETEGKAWLYTGSRTFGSCLKTTELPSSELPFFQTFSRWLTTLCDNTNSRVGANGW